MDIYALSTASKKVMIVRDVKHRSPTGQGGER